MKSFAVTIVLSVAITAFKDCHALLPRLELFSSRIQSAVVSIDRIDRSLRCTDDAASFGATPETRIINSDSVLIGSRLLYFGIPGRGEAVRLALAVGGVRFEDRRVPFPGWGRVKPTTPWGTLPVLELADGSRLAQSRSILRFVGKRTGLYPNDDIIAQRVDELMDALEDLGAIVADVGRGLPRDELEAARLAACSDGGSVHNHLAKIDTFIGANGSGGRAVGSEIGVACILTFTNLGRLVGGVYFGVPPAVCDPFPNLQLVRKTVGCHPAVVAWYDTRAREQKLLSPAEQILASCRDM